MNTQFSVLTGCSSARFSRKRGPNAPSRVHQLDLVASAARGVLGVVFQRDAQIWPRVEKRTAITSFSTVNSGSASRACPPATRPASPPGVRRGRSLLGRHSGLHFAYGRRIGSRTAAASRGHRVHIGVIRLFLFEIFLLLLAVDVGESQKRTATTAMPIIDFLSIKILISCTDSQSSDFAVNDIFAPPEAGFGGGSDL